MSAVMSRATFPYVSLTGCLRIVIIFHFSYRYCLNRNLKVQINHRNAAMTPLVVT